MQFIDAVKMGEDIDRLAPQVLALIADEDFAVAVAVLCNAVEALAICNPAHRFAAARQFRRSADRIDPATDEKPDGGSPNGPA